MHNREDHTSTAVDINGTPVPAPRLDSEVPASAKRRAFSTAEKLRILVASDACKVAWRHRSAVAARRYLFVSFGHLAQAALAVRRLTASRAQACGPKVDPVAAQDRRVRELKNEVARLRDKLAKADLIIEVQKILSTLLGRAPSGTLNELK